MQFYFKSKSQNVSFATETTIFSSHKKNPLFVSKDEEISWLQIGGECVNKGTLWGQIFS